MTQRAVVTVLVAEAMELAVSSNYQIILLREPDLGLEGIKCQYGHKA